MQSDNKRRKYSSTPDDKPTYAAITIESNRSTRGRVFEMKRFNFWLAFESWDKFLLHRFPVCKSSRGSWKNVAESKMHDGFLWVVRDCRSFVRASAYCK